MAQSSQYPAFNNLDANLGFRFVLGPVRTRWDNGDLIVFCELLVAWVKLRIITAGFADAGT